MIMKYNYDEVVILSTQMNDEASKYGYATICTYLQAISKYSLEILKGNLTDNYDQLYYKLAYPMYQLSKDIDIRGFKTKAYKLKELLVPESIKQKRINDNIQYQMYKNHL